MLMSLIELENMVWGVGVRFWERIMSWNCSYLIWNPERGVWNLPKYRLLGITTHGGVWYLDGELSIEGQLSKVCRRQPRTKFAGKGQSYLTSSSWSHGVPGLLKEPGTVNRLAQVPVTVPEAAVINTILCCDFSTWRNGKYNLVSKSISLQDYQT